MSWLDEILDATKDLEAPRSFFFWSSLCAISAVVKDRVVLNRGNAYLLYPNIYVLLHGNSGLGKALPIGLARKMVEAVGNTRVFYGRSSIEEIIEELGRAETTPTGMIADSAGFIVASEFASSIIKNPMAMTILTDLYDRFINEGKWRNRLKSGSVNLKSPTVTLLGGVNEEQFKDVLTVRDIKGGFIGRTFVIMEKRRNKLNSLMRPLEVPLNPQEFAKHLKVLSKLKGEFKLTDEATQYYDDWYYKYYGGEEVEDTTGTHSRIRDSILKVSMLLSLSIDTNLMISQPLLESSIKLCGVLLPSAERTARGKGKSSLAEQTAAFMHTILEAPDYRISRPQILRKHWRDFDSLDLDRIVLTLTDSKVIITSPEEGGKIVYQLTKEGIEQLKAWQERKNESSTKAK